MDFYDLLQNHVGIFVLVMTRISGIFLLSPFFGSQNIPMMIRAGLSFALAILLFPVLDKEMIDNVVLPATVLGYVIVAAEQLFVGWLIGMVSYMIMAAINMGGKIMDMQIGFAMVNVMDPTTNQQNALVGSFLYNLAIIVLLVTNGHHMILSAVVGSFDMVPVGGVSPSSGLPQLISDLTGGIFHTGVKIALPVTFAILVTNVGLGILARTMPQMNIFVVGIPLQLTVGAFVLMMVIPFYIVFLDVIFNAVYANISTAIRFLR